MTFINLGKGRVYSTEEIVFSTIHIDEYSGDELLEIVFKNGKSTYLQSPEKEMFAEMFDKLAR